MRQLWLYDLMARFGGWFTYRAKIMLMAFVGTHIPLIALVSYFALKASSDWRAFITTFVVTLLATLAGTGFTLFVLHHLLRPLALTAHALRTYKTARLIEPLPTHYTDEAGTLMADTTDALVHLDQALDRLENVDGSTGLPNRRRLALDLKERIRNRERTAICAIRFANYSRFIETLDLRAAEQAVREVAGRLEFSTDAFAKLYRVGDAEFILAVKHEAGSEEASAALGARMRDLLTQCAMGIAFSPVTIDPTLRAGIARYPEDASEPDTLIDHALAAVATTSNELQVGFHSSASRRASLDRLLLEQDLRRALAMDEFTLHYQPIVDLSLGRVTGAEALIRWQHPERGMVPPMQFIGVAEQSGLIDPIGLWVIRQACRQAKEWADAGLPYMKVAVNLSARQFLDPRLVDSIRDAIGTAGIAANQLEIELTETAAMADAAHTSAIFGKLRDLGVRIAIDDFGTGYASLSYLRKLPFDKLKIDREFVSNVQSTRDSQAICGALVTLADGLGLEVLAEGTETEAEVAYLRERGCHLYQGYFFSRPLPPAAFQSALGAISLSAMALALRSESIDEIDFPKLARAG